MNITVNEELLAYIDPLTPEEHAALERSLLAEGCRDALVLWGEVLVDGHNRHGICTRHGIAFNTVQNASFKSMADVHLWMIDQHLGRRSVSDFQRGVLALRKKDILAARAQPAPDESPASAKEPAAENGRPEPVPTREAIAKSARISSNTINQIEKIQKSAAPELVAAVKSGTISINAAATVKFRVQNMSSLLGCVCRAVQQSSTTARMIAGEDERRERGDWRRMIAQINVCVGPSVSRLPPLPTHQHDVIESTRRAK